ncbi:28569_t:CDS:2, partial [Gigaspora margarita]
ALYWLLNVENLPEDKNNQVWVSLILGYTIYIFLATDFAKDFHFTKFQVCESYSDNLSKNIKWLCGFVANSYNIFNDFKVQYLANKKLNTLIKSGKRKADEIDKELATNFESNSEHFIKVRLPLTFEGLNIDNRTAQAITLQLEKLK